MTDASRLRGWSRRLWQIPHQWLSFTSSRCLSTLEAAEACGDHSDVGKIPIFKKLRVGGVPEVCVRARARRVPAAPKVDCAISALAPAHRDSFALQIHTHAPQHFNAPWHTAASRGLFEACGLDVEWSDFHGGTGAMTKALREGSIDVAILLTEGIVADLHRGCPAKILGTYVSSPLTWGVHVHESSPLQSIAEAHAAGAKVAVSRFGSGSHLMACVQAHSRGHDPKSLKFHVVNSLEGARTALRDGLADIFVRAKHSALPSPLRNIPTRRTCPYSLVATAPHPFPSPLALLPSPDPDGRRCALSPSVAQMWEKFTTKHLVDAGEWRRIGEFPTPWPCFSIAASDAALASHGPELLAALQVCRSEAMRLRASSGVNDTIGLMFGQQSEDVGEWISGVTWACEPVASCATLHQVMDGLVEAGVLEREELLPPSDLLSPLCADGDLRKPLRSFTDADPSL
jgi:hypothetical protein